MKYTATSTGALHYCENLIIFISVLRHQRGPCPCRISTVTPRSSAHLWFQYFFLHARTHTHTHTLLTDYIQKVCALHRAERPLWQRSGLVDQETRASFQIWSFRVPSVGSPGVWSLGLSVFTRYLQVNG